MMALLKRSLQALHEQAKTRPAGYVDDVLSHAQRVDDAHYWIDPHAYLDLCRRWQTVPPSKPRPSRPRQIANLIVSAARATRSVTKTSLGIDRASDEQVEARLNVCRQCPGNHAIWKNGEVHTCGPMLQSMADEGGGTCGCILRRKARDLTENCPFGWWPNAKLVVHERASNRHPSRSHHNPCRHARLALTPASIPPILPERSQTTQNVLNRFQP